MKKAVSGRDSIIYILRRFIILITVWLRSVRCSIRLMMEQDYERAWKSYLKLCRMSASGFFTDMIRDVGLLNPLEEECIQQLIQQLSGE